jgi:hypothetical protein
MGKFHSVLTLSALLLFAALGAGCPDQGNNQPKPRPGTGQGPPANLDRLSPLYPVSSNYQQPADTHDFSSQAAPRPNGFNPPGTPNVGGNPPNVAPRPGDRNLSLAELRQRRDGAYEAYERLLIAPEASAQSVIDARTVYSYWDGLYQQAVARGQR